MMHPDDADELQEIARELDGESLRGPLSYPSQTGAWQIDETDLGEWFEPFRG